MEPPNPDPPQVRLKELLAVSDRDRTEEEWDELIELEISLAPENRVKRGGGRNDSGGHQGGDAGPTHIGCRCRDELQREFADRTLAGQRTKGVHGSANEGTNDA